MKHAAAIPPSLIRVTPQNGRYKEAWPLPPQGPWRPSPLRLTAWTGVVALCVAVWAAVAISALRLF